MRKCLACFAVIRGIVLSLYRKEKVKKIERRLARCEVALQVAPMADGKCAVNWHEKLW